MTSQPPIGDYAIIGNCRSAALISRKGSIDWLCWPQFHHPSLFARILDTEKGGCFVVQPTGEFSVQRRYLPETNVLETSFTTETGQVRLIDLMPVTDHPTRTKKLAPAHQILRIVECTEGEVEMYVFCDPRPDYGRIEPKLHDRGALGLYYEAGSTALILRTDISLEPREGQPGRHGSVRLRASQRFAVSLVFAAGEPAVIPPLGQEAQVKLDETVAWWRKWASRCTYRGPYRDVVVRSVLALKLLTYAPSGAVIAAPTTSLPEKLGGVRNWDYRYCWLRDASLIVRGLFELGYDKEMESFVGWLLHSTRMSWPELRVLYDVHGETDVSEQELEHLAGYRGARPVRVGNDARGQLQLDIYGELIDAIFRFVQVGGKLDGMAQRMLKGFGLTVCRQWDLPDEGIWEIRSGRKHHTYSRAMCWVALDRLLQMHEQGHLDVPAEEFRKHRNAIRNQIETEGYNEKLDSYTRLLGGDDVDASLLLLGFYGYADPKSERMMNTCRRIQQDLGEGGLVLRYRSCDDGLPPGEGAFGVCSFWGVDSLARGGAHEEAVEKFEHILGFANDLGLFGEEMDPHGKAVLGNFPQAFTHVGLIDAALSLERFGPKGEQPDEEKGRDELRKRPLEAMGVD